MQYRINPKNQDKLSILGFGCMRLGEEKAAAEQVHRAIELGVNYFDTAYIYPGNEALMGRILSGGYRERVRVATKLPPYLVKKPADFDRIFDTQRKRLQTDWIDYYLIHMLPGPREWARLEGLGIREWIEGKLASGQIGSIGFSYHGGREAFTALLGTYSWGFCMLQFNYFDEHSQAGIAGVRDAAAAGIPVMVMEPLRGGMLASLPGGANPWVGAPVRRSPAEWALRWVWSHPEVYTVLSGMKSMDMVEENVRAASDEGGYALTQEDLGRFQEAQSLLSAATGVPCTGCNYCMPCPHGVDIPLCFSTYNDLELGRKTQARMHYILRTDGRQASRCTGCGACEKHCPQSIPIRERLRDVRAAMERFPYRPARFVARKIMRMQ